MIRELYEEICARKIDVKPESYTSYLFLKGEDKILKKIGEECTEIIVAAKNDDKEEIVKELADLAYHCLVLLAEKEIPIEAVLEELHARRGKISKIGERKVVDQL
ncbi:phosphoribosyl-ATP diphosphatase [Priestia taiwanensis]|uniref:Phosphoribosyl-ATP pyrophosphatase n=1 Tax=Priestia taiwanensis TaxID=1347902 RepID=A0A917AJF7_9BACI|nr:phosphoribosyl-ATP diphosphatase [Priestia taiwanensis]MBM7361705.1 phosphoribosyl-ATP pyrophosphohydrolase [Priestia taiwanensis]GGE56345.1 phosphoribosyl-ATP pyrophosphatase [Priestia taiwanensis]